MFWYLWSIPQAGPEGCCIACSPKSGSLQLSFSNTIILNIFMIPFIKPLWTSNYQLSEMLLKKSIFFLHFIQPCPSLSSIWRLLSPCPAPFFLLLLKVTLTLPCLCLTELPACASLRETRARPSLPTIVLSLLTILCSVADLTFVLHYSMHWPSLPDARQLAPQTFWLQQLRICPFSSPDMDTLHCSR